jgi:hypothetical protein
MISDHKSTKDKLIRKMKSNIEHNVGQRNNLTALSINVGESWEVCRIIMANLICNNTVYKRNGIYYFSEEV